MVTKFYRVKVDDVAAAAGCRLQMFLQRLLIPVRSGGRGDTDSSRGELGLSESRRSELCLSDPA